MKVSVCFVCLFFTFINAARSQKLYTTNLGSNNSTVVDTKTNTVINTIPLANNPFGVVTNPVLNKVYFSNYNSSSVSVLNPCSNSIEFIITGLGTNPSGMSVSPDGQRLYVSIHGENKIKVINTATNTVIATIVVGTLPISAPHLSVVSYDNSKVYVTLFDEDKVAVINAATNTVIGYYATDSRPSGIDLSTDNSKLYVTNYYPPQLSVYNTTTGVRTNVISLGAPVPNGTESAVDVVLNNANTKAYVSMVHTSSVSVINTATNTVTNTIPTGLRGLGIDINPDDSKVYLSCATSNRIDVINTTTNVVANSIAVGNNPYCIGRLLLHTNIDSVKITPAQISCLSYNFNGQAFVNNSPITNWQWYFGDGGQATTQNTSHSYAGAGTYTVKLVVTDGFGCKDSITTNVTSGTGASANAGNDSTVCAGIPFNLLMYGTNLATYSWSPAALVSNPSIANPVATLSGTQKFYCTVTNSSGCSVTDSVTYTVVPMNVNTTDNTNLCNGSTLQLNTTGAASYSWSPTAGLSNPSIGNPIASPTITTKYYVTGTSALGCTGIDSITISVIPSPTVVTTIDSAICTGTSIQLNTIGSATYSWSPATGLSNPSIANPIATPTVPTQYIVTGTAANGCIGKDTVNISLKPLPVITATNDSTICNGLSVQLNASGSLTYSWSPTTGLSNPFIANPVATPSVPTQYIVTGTAVNGCTGKDTVNINLTPLPVVDATPDNNLCIGSSMQLNATGAVTYSWSPAAGLSNTAIANPVASPTITTKYYVIGTAASGCKGIDSVTITLIPVPTVVTTIDSAICTGTSIQLNTIGAASYSWSPGTGLSNPSIANPIATPTVPTQYIVTGTAANGCIAKDTVNISLKPLPVITATIDSTICPGRSVQLNSSGGGSYSWSPATGLNNASISNPIATPLVNTQYIVSGTGVNGCVGKDTVNISLHPATVVDATPDNNLCTGSSMPLNATGATTYSWSPATGLSSTNTPNPVATPAITTKYYVTGTSANGCTGIDSVTITLIPVPTVVTTIDSAICTGTSIQLNTIGAASYSWSPATGLSNPSIANPIATPSINTQYIVTGTAANSCTAKDTINISLKPLPSITATIDSTICPGRSVQLNSSGGGSYSWSPATGLNNASISNPIATPLVNTQYIVSGTGANGCTGKDTVNISLHPGTVVDATPDNNLCTGSSMPLNATGAATYSWSPSAGLSSTNIPNPVATPVITTKYYVNGTSANGCTGIDSVTITLIPVPTVVTTIDSAICTGTSIQLNTIGAASYSWSPATGLSNPSIANPIATPTVPTQYIVTGTAANSCTAKDTVNIGLKPAPVITKSNDTTICTAGSAQLNVTGGVTYSWTPVTGLNNPSIPNPVASPTTTTNYKVTVTGANSCSKLDSIKVTAAPAPVYTISSPAPICNNSSVQLLATGGDIYSWLPVTGLSNPLIANPQASPNITTPYAVRIISSLCHDTVFRATVVTVNQLPTITALKSNDIDCSFPTAQLLATGGISYVWSPSTGLNNANIANPTTSITTNTTYTVTGTDFNNCTSTATVTVQAGFVNGGNLYIPNAFTPNGDGKNDCFGIRVYGVVNYFELSVFNRYGEKIFYTTNPSKCWDGTYKTKKQQIGNYVYIVKAKSSCGDFFRKGSLVLLQ